MSNISISHITSKSPLYEQVLELREEVLRKPLGLSLKNEDLSRDHQDTIFIAIDNNRVIACLLLHTVSKEQVQLRAMAVYDEWQGKGTGRLLVAAAEAFCREQGYGVIMLHARKVAVGFYKSLNYSITSGEFTEVGIPHFIMEKSIAV